MAISAPMPKSADKAHLFYETVEKVTADLREKGPTADEFERAAAQLDSLDRAFETNGWKGFLAVLRGRAAPHLIRQARPG